MHGSSGARALNAAAGGGLRVCVTVTIVDALVFARAAVTHSINYRSVTVHGVASVVAAEADKRAALDALVNAAAPGRASQTRAPNARELAATTVLAVPMDAVSLKVRTGPPNDEAEDREIDYWAGELPLATVAGEPVSAPGVTCAVPEAIRQWRASAR